MLHGLPAGPGAAQLGDRGAAGGEPVVVADPAVGPDVLELAAGAAGPVLGEEPGTAGVGDGTVGHGVLTSGRVRSCCTPPLAGRRRCRGEGNVAAAARARWAGCGARRAPSGRVVVRPRQGAPPGSRTGSAGISGSGGRPRARWTGCGPARRSSSPDSAPIP